MYNANILSIESYSFGISGLDTKIMTHISPEQGVVMAPLDPWFIFSPTVLPNISTEWVRQFNLVPSQLRWFYWLSFDDPFHIFEWHPKWDPQIKRFLPLNASSYPIKLPTRHIPLWVQNTKDLFVDQYLETLEASYLPQYVLEHEAAKRPPQKSIWLRDIQL